MISQELASVKETYGDRRRTQIVQLKHGDSKAALLTATDLAPSESVWIAISEDGLVGRLAEGKQPRPSGSDVPYWLFQANTRDVLYLVSDNGLAATVAVHALPPIEKPSEGALYSKLSALSQDDILAAAFTLPSSGTLPDDWYLLTVTRQGMLKKSQVLELPGLSAKPFAVVKVNDDDRLGWIRLTDGKQQLLLATGSGMAIRFSEDEIRPMGLVAAGVMGVKLQRSDEVVGVELLPVAGEVLLVSSDGRAKRVAQDQFPVQGRYGQGVIAWKLPSKTRLAGIAAGKGTLRVTLHLMKLSAKSMRLDEAPLQTRSARGQEVVELKAGDEVLGLTVPRELPRPLDSGSSDPGEKPAPRKRRPPEEENDGAAPAAARTRAARSAPAKPAAEKTPTGASRAKKASGTSAGSSTRSSSKATSKAASQPPAPRAGRKKPAVHRRPPRQNLVRNRPPKPPASLLQGAASRKIQPPHPYPPPNARQGNPNRDPTPRSSPCCRWMKLPLPVNANRDQAEMSRSKINH